MRRKKEKIQKNTKNAKNAKKRDNEDLDKNEKETVYSILSNSIKTSILSSKGSKGGKSGKNDRLENVEELDIDEKELLESFEKEIYDLEKVDDLIKTITKEMKPLQSAVKSLKSEKKEIEQGIAKFMGSYGFEAVNLPGRAKDDPKGAIKYHSTEAMLPMTQARVKEALSLFYQTGPGSKFRSNEFNSLDPEKKTEVTYNFIYDRGNRKKNVREGLRRVKYVDLKVKREVDIEVELDGRTEADEDLESIDELNRDRMHDFDSMV